MEAKPLWTSRTFWVNLVALAAAAGTLFGLPIPVDDQAAMVGGAMSVVNIILRMITTQPVTVTPTP